MCGRYEFDPESGSPAVRKLLEKVRVAWPDLVPVAGKREIGPGEEVAALADDGGPKATLRRLRWGMQMGKRLVINARAETVAARPLFRDAFHHRRCALLATGFYEWSPAPEHRKVLFRLCDADEFCLAAIRDASDQFVILTVPAEPPVAAVHARMPIVLRLSELLPWLRDPAFAAAALSHPGLPLQLQAEGNT